MMRKVYLEGELATRFGEEFEMSVNSFGEALACLEVNFPEFREYLIESCDNGTGFVCQVGQESLNSEEELLINYKKGDFILTPVPSGSGSGIGKIFAAIAIVAVVWATGGFAAIGAAAGGGGMTLGAAAALGGLGMAVSLALQGIAQLMAPDPSVDVQQDKSYLFQGAGQTILEGDPVPVVYGRLRVPGRPISFEIKNANTQFTDYASTGYDYIENNDDGGGPNPPGSPDNGKDTSQQGGFTQE